MHVFYGIGMLIGLVRSVIMKAHGADLANYKFVVKRIKAWMDSNEKVRFMRI